VGYGGVLGSKSVSGLVAVLGKDPRLDIAATPGTQHTLNIAHT
jgi:hypothetical protein